MIDIEELLLMIENKQVELEYNSSFTDKEDLNKLFLEQVLKKTVNNGYNDILVDYESSDYNICIEIYKILSSNKVMNLILKVLIFLIIGLFGLSLYGVFYFIYFMLRLIFV